MAKATYLRRLKLAELSLVDRPANPGAQVTIFKRDVSDENNPGVAKEGGAMPDGSFPIKTKDDLKNAIQAFGRAKDKAKAKAHIMSRARALGAADMIPENWVTKFDELCKAMYPEPGDGGKARPFSEILAEQEARQRQYEASEEIWPMFRALQESLQTIIADQSLSQSGKMEMIRSSVEDFLNAVAASVPDIEDELNKILNQDPAVAEFFSAGEPAGDHPVDKGDKLMSDENKQVAELQKQIADLTTQIGELTKRAETAESEVAKAAEASDEVLKVGTSEIKKSVVGAETFELIKAREAEFAKAAEEAEINKAKERVEKEFPNLPGAPVEKAEVILRIEKMPARLSKAAFEMLAAGNTGIGESMKVLGKDGESQIGKNDNGSVVTKAEMQINAKAKEIQKSEGLSEQAAIAKAWAENPELYNSFLSEKAA